MGLFVLYNEVSLSQGLTHGMRMCSSHSCTVVMASRSIVGPQETEMMEVNEYIRGYLYKAVWEATCGDVLRLEREHNNK